MGIKTSIRRLCVFYVLLRNMAVLFALVTQDQHLLSLSQFLWEITVSGGEVYSESDILKYVTDNYYHIGTLKYQIDCDALEDHLREDYAEIAWASCSIQGTRLHIEIKETLDRKTKQNPKKPCDIVANKSGIITKMAVKSGTPLVSVGDSVKSGTTLISGLIYYYSDDFTVTQTDKIKADGEIVMRTKEVYNNSIPMEYYEKLITGKKKSIKNLYFGQYQFDFPEKKRQDHTNVMTKRRSLKIGTSFYLPIGITMQITEKYRPKKKILTKKEAQLKLKKQLERYLMKKAKAGAKIVHCEGNYKKKNNRYEVNASIIKEESVGKIRNIKKLTKKQEEMITPTTAQQ